MKAHTHLIIIGGGIFGAAVAYYFKRDNPEKKVVVYERNELCSGNTSMAAALLSRVRAYKHVLPLSLETYRVIPELELLTGSTIPVKYNGAMHIASDFETENYLEQMMKVASECGIEWEYISKEKLKKKIPWLNCLKAKKNFFIPGEAITDAYIIGMAFANAAKKLGVEFSRHKEVTGIIKVDNKVTGIKTSQEIHEADITVLAAGVWSMSLAYDIGIALPMAPVRSQYWITGNSESLFSSSSPTVLIPGANYYSRPLGNSLLFGIREASPVYADPRHLPDDINSYLFSTNNGWNDLIDNFDKIVPFFPQFGNIKIKNYVAGFSAYTPDNQFIAGEVPGIRGLLLATGCVGAGISVSGGIGLGIASLAAGRPNPFDFSHYKPDRFGLFDPFSKEHLMLCAEARSKKISG